MPHDDVWLAIFLAGTCPRECVVGDQHGRMDEGALRKDDRSSETMTNWEARNRIVEEVIAEGLSVARAAKLLPGRGEAGASPATTWRYMSTGINGADGRRVRLESARVGGTLYTSRAAIARFIAALQGPVEDDAPSATPAPAPAAQTRRKREVASAEAQLAELGV